MKIEILCSDPRHPVQPHLSAWVAEHAAQHTVRLCMRKAELEGGDILFLVSSHELICAETRALFGACLVLHASRLPQGRGWSPHVWDVLAGASCLTLTLLEAARAVDSGAIWLQVEIPLQGHELHDEINHKLFEAEMALMREAVARFGGITPRPQADTAASYHRRRTPEDSRLDPARSLESQFDLLRVADPQRFPAFFELRGQRYELLIRKAPPTGGDDTP